MGEKQVICEKNTNGSDQHGYKRVGKIGITMHIGILQITLLPGLHLHTLMV